MFFCETWLIRASGASEPFGSGQSSPNSPLLPLSERRKEVWCTSVQKVNKPAHGSGAEHKGYTYAWQCIGPANQCALVGNIGYSARTFAEKD